MVFAINTYLLCLIYILFNFKLEFSFDDINEDLLKKEIYTNTDLQTI